MSQTPPPSQPDLEALLESIRLARQSASLRVDGTDRVLGHLQVRSLEPGTAIQLEGAKRRDLLPAPGSKVTLSFLLEDEVVSLHTVLLDPLLPRTLRAAWPEEAPDRHRREEVRVATPALPPLKATLLVQGRRLQAKLLNLTENGLGLGLKEAPPVPLEGEVLVETQIPGGIPLRMVGEVRHWDQRQGDPLPFRVGLVLRDLPPAAQESLRRMIQARRIILSDSIRKE